MVKKKKKIIIIIRKKKRSFNLIFDLKPPKSWDWPCAQAINRGKTYGSNMLGQGMRRLPEVTLAHTYWT